MASVRTAGDIHLEEAQPFTTHHRTIAVNEAGV